MVAGIERSRRANPVNPAAFVPDRRANTFNHAVIDVAPSTAHRPLASNTPTASLKRARRRSNRPNASASVPGEVPIVEGSSPSTASANNSNTTTTVVNTRSLRNIHPEVRVLDEKPAARGRLARVRVWPMLPCTSTWNAATTGAHMIFASR